MSQERNLLFAVLAVRTKGLSPAHIGEAFAAAGANASFRLDESLVEQGYLSQQDSVLLGQMVDEAIEAHGGDVSDALGTSHELREIADFIPSDVAASPLDDMRTIGMSVLHSSPDSDEPPPPVVEEMLGRYAHISDHARGGMGRILLVYDQCLGRSVALKELLPPSPTGSADDSPGHPGVVGTARFLQEARVAGQLEHPSIVPVYELGRRKDGTLYYTMRLVKGKTLSEALRERRSFRERLDLLKNFLDLCQAIAYAHSRGVVHRDIKPANVMVGSFGETVVLDWGLAKAQGTKDYYSETIEAGADDHSLPQREGDSGTVYGHALGTPNYMPPEQARGLVDQIDVRSDVYSLGAVLYEILAGRPPHSGSNTREVLEKVIHVSPEPVRAVVPNAPPELAVICEKALNKNPADRYASAADLAEDIHRFVTGSLVRAYSYSPKDIVMRFVRKHRVAVITAIVSFVLMALLGIQSYVSILNARDREHRQRLAAEEAKNSEMASRLQAERAAYVTQLALTQEYIGAQDYAMANKTLWSVPAAHRGWEWEFLMNRANPELVTVAIPTSRIACATVSPDGALVATVSDSGVLQICDTKGEKPAYTCESGSVAFSQPCQFSPDGTRILGGALDGNVRLWDVTSGRLLRTFSGHKGPVFSVGFNPGGSRAISASLDGTACVWDLASGAPVATIDPKTGALIKAFFSPSDAMLATISQSNQIKIWNSANLKELFECPGQTAAFSRKDLLAVAAKDGGVSIWDPMTSTCRSQFVTGGLVRHIRFDHSSERLITASADGNAKLWDVGSGRLIHRYSHGAPLLDAAFARGETVIVTCSLDNEFVAWDLETGGILNRMRGRGRSLSSVDYALDGNLMVTATNEEYFQVWDPLYQTGRRLLSRGKSRATLISLDAPPGRTGAIAFISEEDDVQLVSADGTGRKVTYSGNVENPILFRGVAIREDGTEMAAILDPFVPVVWDLGGQDFVQLFGHEGDVESVAFAPDGPRVVTASTDMTARVWDTKSGTCLAILSGHKDGVLSASFSPDGTRVLTASMDGFAKVWDSRESTERLSLEGHSAPLRAAAFSIDGRRVFTASEDRSVRVWDAVTGEPLAVLEGHGGIVNGVSQSTDGRYLLTSSDDGASRLWDADRFEQLLTFPGTAKARYMSSPPVLVTLRGDGRVESWHTLSSYAPGCPDTDESAFARYRQADHLDAAQQPIPGSAPDQRFVVLSNQTVERCLRRLIESLRVRSAAQTFSQEDLVFRSGEDSPLRAFVPLGLRDGDTLISFCETDASHAESFLSRLEQAISSTLSEPSGQLTLVLWRQGKPIPTTVVTRPCRQESIHISVSPDRALDILRMMIEDTVPPALSTAQAERSEISSPNACFAGLAMLFSPSVTGKHDAVLASRLARSDLVVGVNGTSISDSEAVVQRLAEVQREISDGDRTSFSLDVQRGEFIRLRLDYQIK